MTVLAKRVGAWRCRGRMYGRPGVPGYAVIGNLTYEALLGGTGLAWKYEQVKTPANPTPYAGAGLIGWDALRRRYIDRNLDRFGGIGVAISTDGSAWRGTTRGPMGTTQDRTTITQPPAGPMLYKIEVLTPGGWKPFTDESCVRAP